MGGDQAGDQGAGGLEPETGQAGVLGGVDAGRAVAQGGLGQGAGAGPGHDGANRAARPGGEGGGGGHRLPGNRVGLGVGVFNPDKDVVAHGVFRRI